MKLLRAAVYNPLSLMQAYRCEDISRVLRAVSFIAMPGTQSKMKGGRKHFMASYDKHWAVHWGFAAGAACSNRSAGVSIMVDHRLPASSVVQVFDPQPIFQGRAGGLRIKASGMDIAPLCLYFPVKATSEGKVQVFKKTVHL